MKKIVILLLLFFPLSICAQDFYGEKLRNSWLDQAEKSKPILVEQIKRPIGLVKLVADERSFQGWATKPSAAISDLYARSFKSQSGTVVDFGQHLTGYYEFTIRVANNVMDAPLKFKLTFGEVPAEIATPFDPYPGRLSRGWLQDEVITVTELPATIRIARRLSFRYLKIDLLGSSLNFDFKITDMQLKAVTSADSKPDPLSPATSAMISKIDAVGLATLSECMQTVYEDGPKRDRRLWIGDLYLEALANAYSFKKHELTKRCLYLLAGVSKKNGFLYPCVFESPQPHTQEGAYLFEYSLLYNVALKEYLAASKDKQTALDLWPVAKKQLENITKHLSPDGLLDTESAQKDGWWLFVDWRDGLDRQASVQGIMIFAIQESMALAKQIGKQHEVIHLEALLSKMIKAARTLYDKESGLFVSGKGKQISYASQSWMVISGVATQKEAQRAMKAITTYQDVVKPGTPYLMHYYIEALIKSGLKQEARKVMEDYWGGMIKKQADTFWEAYDPENDKLSPYNFFPVNSYCHAWSCTPVYFIRKYPDVFQR